jgi:hypothetical protein
MNKPAILLSLAATVLAAALAGAQSGAKQLAATVRPEARVAAASLSVDRGAAGRELALRRLATTASVMMIDAHPDDEDAALLTYLARGVGARVVHFTLTRGEGGQNAISAEANDGLGLIRTGEMLAADAY